MERLQIFHFGEFQVDPGSRSVKRGEEPLALSRRAFEVLLYFVSNPGKVLGKDELLRNVWPDAFVDENNLAQSISVLRKALGDRPGESGYIVTLPGRGYQFTCAVHVVSPDEEPADAALSTNAMPETAALLYREQIVRTTVITESSERLALPAPKPRRRLWLASSLAFLTLAGATGAVVWGRVHRIPPDPIVVISSIQNNTGDAGLDDALNSAIETDLKQSPYLDFLSAVHVQDTLAQMQQKKDAVLTPTLAREICLRNNAQVMLQGVITRFGQRYLLTLNATDCTSGKSLASAKSEASSPDTIPHVIDTVAADLRRQLGESRASIHRFETPLSTANTGSFEALRSFSDASSLAHQGRYADAIPMYQRAIELDPKFAMAYAELSGAYRNVGERAQEVTLLSKAFELRDSANERDRFYITARYHQSVTGNLEEGLRNYRAWTGAYPRNPQAWGNMADVYTQLGQAELAIAPAQRSVDLDSKDAVGYVILGRALMHAGQLQAAKTVCEQAIAKGLDGDDLHSLLMQVNVALNNDDGVAKQMAWAKTHSSASRMRLNEALLDFSKGQIRQGQDVLATIASSYKQQGLTRLYAVYSLAASRILAETGHNEEAEALLKSQASPPGVMDPLIAMAEVGRGEQAKKILDQELAQHPDDTLWTSFRAPQVHAVLLLSAHKPQEAIEALRPALPYDLRNFEVPYLRGMAYLQVRQPAEAEREFRKIIDHRGIDPLSHLYAMAHLQIARALAQEGRMTESQSAYETFFALWKNADPNEPLLKEAQQESNRLKSPPSRQ